MQRHHSNVSSHAHGSFEVQAARSRSGSFVTRGARSISGALQRSLAPHSIGSPHGGTATQHTSLALSAVIRPGDDLSLPMQLSPATGLAPSRPVGGAWKRAFDMGVASLALVLLSPLLLITALLIKFSMGGPALLAHSRIGLNGKVFRRYKFRTMTNDAEENLSRNLARGHHVACEWKVTALGQILRSAGIDELPQLINVLRGDMSLIGPRPATTMELQRYGAHVTEYLKMRPGLTGLWQISARDSSSCAQRIELDGLYARSWSMRLDLAIITRTVAATLKLNQAA